MNQPNRRKYVRRDVDYACWIGAGDASTLVQASVQNISEGGAKVVCRAQVEIPETVDLYMTQDGRVGRRCKVVWRSDDALGLMFISKATFEAPDATFEI
jgi:hypothetical protein